MVNGRFQVKVFRVGMETPQSVSASVRAYLEELRPELPDGIGFAMWNDRSEIYQDRMNLLLKNAFLGLTLVLLLLGLFLDLKLAFWVTVGLPVSIIGSFLFIPFTGASINMISLFAFIITLGIIVDDAVVAGEIIYQKREQGLPLIPAAIAGAREIAGPIMFAVLTNIAAFMPLFFVARRVGEFLEAGARGGGGGVRGVADRVVVRVAGASGPYAGTVGVLENARPAATVVQSSHASTSSGSATSRFSEARSPIAG